MIETIALGIIAATIIGAVVFTGLLLLAMFLAVLESIGEFIGELLGAPGELLTSQIPYYLGVSVKKLKKAIK